MPIAAYIRAVSLPSVRTTFATALLVLVSVLALDCRDDTTPAGPRSPAPFALTFARGDRLTFDAWDLDLYGYVVPNSHSTRTWTVLGTSLTMFGRSNVIMIADSGLSALTHSRAIDTLLLQIDGAGDLYQHGFLSRAALRHTGQIVPRNWDRLGGFSQGTGSNWTVGIVDTSQSTAMGTLAPIADLFAVPVDAVVHVMSAYEIDIVGPDIQYAMRITAGSPSCIPEILDEPGLSVGGFYYKCNGVYTAARGG